jgi:hypothetical protein
MAWAICSVFAVISLPFCGFSAAVLICVGSARPHLDCTSHLIGVDAQTQYPCGHAAVVHTVHTYFERLQPLLCTHAAAPHHQLYYSIHLC